MKQKLIFLSLMLLSLFAVSAKDIKVDNVKYKISKEGFATIVDATKVGADFKIPSEVTDPKKGVKYTVTAIGDGAFKESAIENAELPETIENLGNYSFLFCENLKKVSFGSKIIRVPQECFRGCKSLESIDLTGTGIKYIKIYAFSGCESLKNLTIPPTLKSIDGSAFSGCPIETLTVEDSPENFILYCKFNDSLKSVYLGRNILDDGIGVFNDCDNLEEITLGGDFNYHPETTRTGKNALLNFRACKGLKQIKLDTWKISPDRLPYLADCLYVDVIAPNGDIIRTDKQYEELYKLNENKAKLAKELLIGRKKIRSEYPSLSKIVAYYKDKKNSNITPLRVDDLKNGMKCTHFAESYRGYSKPNGDYMIFSEFKDSRDPKTYDLIKGIDMDIDDNTEALAFKLTYPDGTILESDKLTGWLHLNNGSSIELATFYYYNSVWGTASREIKLNFAEFVTLETPINDYLVYFLDYDSGKSGNIYGDLKPIKLACSIKDNIIYLICLEDKNKVAYEITNDGLYPVGVISGSALLKSRSKASSVSGNMLKFENGDYIYAFDISSNQNKNWNFNVHLKDGRVIESAPNASGVKISYPNGDRFVGEIDGYLLNPEEKNGVLNAPDVYFGFTGIYTTAKGKEYTYKNGRCAEIENAKNAKKAAELKAALIKKYGKAQIDQLEKDGISVGLNFELVKILWPYSVSYDSESSYGTWYKVATDIKSDLSLVYRYILVNKKTGKITYIGSTIKTSMF